MFEERDQTAGLVDLVVMLVEEHHEYGEVLAFAPVHGLDRLRQPLDVTLGRLAPGNPIRLLPAVESAEVVDPQNVIEARLADGVAELVVELVVEDVVNRVRVRESLAQ